MKKKVISVRELVPFNLNQLPPIKIDKNKVRQELLKEISIKNKELKRNLGMRENPIFVSYENGEYSLKFTGISGVLSLGNLEFEIIPKFINEQDQKWRSSIFNLISISRRKWIHPEHFTSLGADKLNFYDHLALAFIDALNKALMYEPIQSYSSFVNESRYLRGRLLVNDQISKVLTKPGILVTEVDVYNTENEYNFLIKWALNQLLTRTKNLSIKAKLRSLGESIPLVSKSYVIPIQSKLPPQYKHYEEVIELSNMLAKGIAKSHKHGEESGYGYVLNMESIYEGFIENLLRKIVKEEEGWQFQAQSSQMFAEAVTEGENSFFTIPDNKILIDNEPRILIDAKYKASLKSSKNKRPVSSDFYQIFSSLVAHGCNIGLLINPRESNEAHEEIISLWEIDFKGEKFTIGSFSLDISDLKTLVGVNKVKQSLTEKIKELINR